jgi:2-polyprenyl-3-methyl-5-hydroxy-6-metoxy-1,4-benzoquinol methylase
MSNNSKSIVFAILAKDKAHCLPIYLKCLELQTWPKAKTHIYIRTNNNNDNTKLILEEWVKKITAENQYQSVYINTEDIAARVQAYKPHEWNNLRFVALAKIRQDSVSYAIDRGAHYFTADCDNFIIPITVENLVKTGLPAIGPLLTDSNWQTNIHHRATATGYFDLTNPHDIKIVSLNYQGLILVDVIHCTYLYRNEILKDILYNDGSGRYEYTIVADGLRKKGISQYVDNRIDYGRLCDADTKDGLVAKKWYHCFDFANPSITMVGTGMVEHPSFEISNHDFDVVLKNNLYPLKILFGPKNGLKRDVTKIVSHYFCLDNKTLIIPKGTNLVNVLGNCRNSVQKVLEFYIILSNCETKLIKSIDEILLETVQIAVFNFGTAHVFTKDTTIKLQTKGEKGKKKEQGAKAEEVEKETKKNQNNKTNCEEKTTKSFLNSYKNLMSKNLNLELTPRKPDPILDTQPLNQNHKQSRHPKRLSEVALVFTKMQLENKGSGPGSTPESTIEYRGYIERFLQEKNIHSVLDIGCGDWSFSQHINWGSCIYKGIDCVPSIVETNNKTYASKTVHFFEADIFSEPIKQKKYDLILLKDVLQHWPLSKILEMIPIFQSKARYLLVTNCCHQIEPIKETPIGTWQQLSGTMHPLSLFLPKQVLQFGSKETLLIYGTE